MKDRISIVVMVDAVGALSDRTLHNGNLSLVDDSSGSKHQGTPDLITTVIPGQVVQWTPIHIDVQTPVEIYSIEFLPGAPAAPPAGPSPAAPPPVDAMGSNGTENHDLLVWEGVVPYDMTPGVPYRYRLSLKLHEGPNSVLHVDSPALMRV
ncbi:hypothetical protein [Sphaerisporangium corydalis]|uniref:Uncharacterized protein n=1 Tax=Sphaerisporangium corydalis TaxID=1441875 RepID=A0ABV9EFI8_9ACTN|nr:hypothetical protein [Sphaerisporangium corydalis]